jgi:hypothetical protein
MENPPVKASLTEGLNRYNGKGQMMQNQVREVQLPV